MDRGTDGMVLPGDVDLHHECDEGLHWLTYSVADG